MMHTKYMIFFGLVLLPSVVAAQSKPVTETAPASVPATQPTSAPTSAPTSTTQPSPLPDSLPVTPKVSTPESAPSPFELNNPAPPDPNQGKTVVIADDPDAEDCLGTDLTKTRQEREQACQRYLINNPYGALEGPVRHRQLQLLGRSKGEYTPTESKGTEQNALDDYLHTLRHPRKSGDIALFLALGENTPNNTIGLQLGYYLNPHLQAGISGGGGATGVRGGLWGRVYLQNARITPMASLALSYSPGTTGQFAQPIEPGSEQTTLQRITLGQSLLTHLGLGASLRNNNGLSASLEGGFALPLLPQTIEDSADPTLELTDPESLRDGGLFIAALVGFTF